MHNRNTRYGSTNAVTKKCLIPQQLPQHLSPKKCHSKFFSKRALCSAPADNKSSLKGQKKKNQEPAPTTTHSMILTRSFKRFTRASFSTSFSAIQQRKSISKLANPGVNYTLKLNCIKSTLDKSILFSLSNSTFPFSSS